MKKRFLNIRGLPAGMRGLYTATWGQGTPSTEELAGAMSDHLSVHLI